MFKKEGKYIVVHKPLVVSRVPQLIKCVWCNERFLLKLDAVFLLVIHYLHGIILSRNTSSTLDDKKDVL